MQIVLAVDIHDSKWQHNSKLMGLDFTPTLFYPCTAVHGGSLSGSSMNLALHTDPILFCILSGIWYCLAFV